MNKCECCDNEHDGKFGAGRFCNIKCARAFSTKKTRQQINQKIAETLCGRSTSHPHITSLFQIHKKTAQKVMRRMGLGCFRCGWDEAACDMHHILGRQINDADAHTNLTYICPNCHRLFHSNILKPEDAKTIEQVVGSKWKEHYFHGVLQKHK